MKVAREALTQVGHSGQDLRAVDGLLKPSDEARPCTCTLRINTTGSPGRLSQEQKGLSERALIASQRPSHSSWRPRRRPCRHTSFGQATFPCRFPPPCVLTPPRAAATAAPERATPPGGSIPDPSAP